jgi:raffinose/stachyose/melibiose transport system permease protein
MSTASRWAGRENRGWHLIFSLLVGVVCLITIVLFVTVFVSSVKPSTEIFRNIWALPKKLTLGNYAYLIQHNFLYYFLNSTIVMVGSIALTLFLASMTAFGLGKFTFKGNRLIYGYFILGLLFPARVAIVPLFNIVRLFHLYDNLFGITLLYAAAMSIPVFVLTNFLSNVPNSILESAKIDGAGYFRIYAQITMPLIQPAIGALIPLTAIGLWNDLFYPLVFIHSDLKKTVPLGVLGYYSGRMGAFDPSKYGIAFAAISASIIPMLQLYIFGASRIIENITQGSIKQ